ncbi:MAG: SHOCT domain-containing protein [Smithella sp.]
MWMILIVVVSAIWVVIDAKNIGVKKGLVTGLGNMGPWSWFFVTLLLWIIGFPMYLYYRGKFKLAVAGTSNAEKTPTSASINVKQPDNMAIEDLEKLAALKDKGLITQGEFEIKKKQILGI